MKYLLIILTVIGLVGCKPSSTNVSQLPNKLVLVGEIDFELHAYLYQHSESKNCYLWVDGVSRAGFSQVPCEDFMPNQESEQETYQRLKAKYE